MPATECCTGASRSHAFRLSCQFQAGAVQAGAVPTERLVCKHVTQSHRDHKWLYVAFPLHETDSKAWDVPIAPLFS